MVGILGELKVHRSFVRLAAGIGGWGYKFSFGYRFENNPLRGWGFGLSFSLNSGTKSFVQNFEVKSGQILTTKEVELELYQAYTLNLTIAHSWIINGKHKFFIETGYAIPSDDSPYRVKNGDVLSEKSKIIMAKVAPGGTILSIGFLFGIR